MEPTLDGARFPTLAAYLASLPEGLDSYPEACSKGSLLLSSLDGHDIAPMLEGLPERLANVLRDPPPAGIWIPAVLSDAIFHVVVDTHYPDEDAMLRWTHERTVAMAKNRLYQTLFRVAGPALFLRMGAKAHGLIQKGTSVEVTLGEQKVMFVERFPPYLHSHQILLCNVALMQGLVEITGGRDVSATMTSEGPEEAYYECTWT